jgi:broad specificity phosphatase PhoE
MLPPSYETDDMVLPRVFLALDNIRKNHPGQTVVVVCHAGVIYAVEAYLKAQAGHKNPRRVRIGNLSGRWVMWDGSVFKLGKRISLLDEDETGSAIVARTTVTKGSNNVNSNNNNNDKEGEM